jgi:hypothetical protein
MAEIQYCFFESETSNSNLACFGGKQRWIHDELCAMAEMQYRYQEEIDSGDTVEALAIQLLPMNQYGSDVLQVGKEWPASL